MLDLIFSNLQLIGGFIIAIAGFIGVLFVRKSGKDAQKVKDLESERKVRDESSATARKAKRASDRARESDGVQSDPNNRDNWK